METVTLSHLSMWNLQLAIVIALVEAADKDEAIRILNRIKSSVALCEEKAKNTLDK